MVPRLPQCVYLTGREETEDGGVVQIYQPLQLIGMLIQRLLPERVYLYPQMLQLARAELALPIQNMDYQLSISRIPVT